MQKRRLLQRLEFGTHEALETVPGFACTLASAKRSDSNWAGRRASSRGLYAENQRSAAADIAQSDTIYAPLCTVLDAQGGEWSGQLKDLLKLLSDALPVDAASQDLRRSKEWPKTPRALGGRLRRLTPALASAAVTVEEGGRSNGKIGWRIFTNVHCRRALLEPAGGAN